MIKHYDKQLNNLYQKMHHSKGINHGQFKEEENKAASNLKYLKATINELIRNFNNQTN